MEKVCPDCQGSGGNVAQCRACGGTGRVERQSVAAVDWPMVIFVFLVGLFLLAEGWLFKIFGVGALVGSAIYLLGCWLYRANRPFRSPILGWILKLIGVAGVAAIFTVGFFGDASATGALLPPHLGFYFLFALVWLALVPMHLGYKLCQRTFIARQHTDSRPPIVFLRAFDDDEFTSLQPTGWIARFHGITPPFALFERGGRKERANDATGGWLSVCWRAMNTNFPQYSQSALIPIHPVRLIKLLFNADCYYSEELFASVFRKLGPVVAIGRPGEWFASAGAEKMYVRDSEWMQVVLDYLSQCRVVILQPSKSEGVRWEVEQVLLRVPLEKVILCLSNFHGKPDDYEEFRSWVRDRTNLDLPPEVPTLSTPAFVYFEADGTPKVQPVCYRSPLLWPFVASGVDGPRTFGSFLRRLEGKPSGDPAKPRRHFGQEPLSVLLTFALFFGFISAAVSWGPTRKAPEKAAAQSDLGAALLEKGQVDDAVACFKKAIALEPRLAIAHSNLGAALNDKRLFDDAIASCKKAIALDPKLAMARYNLGNALYGKSQVDDAIACYRKSIALEPNYGRAHKKLGAALERKEQLDDAIACYRKAIALDPRDALAHNNLGWALYRKGQVEDAIACYEKAIAFDPKHGPPHNNLGVALQGKGLLDDAIVCFQKATVLDPKNAKPQSNLGAALYDKRLLDDAIGCCKKAIALDPKLAVAHCNLGNALYGKGQVDDAIACYERAIELDPKCAAAHSNLDVALKELLNKTPK